jgi:NDP-sugar pyrophosphorylase family protein
MPRVEKFICIKEKPIEKYHINSGIYVIEPEFIDLIPYDTFIDMPDIFTIAKKSNKNVTVCPIIETWSDIGRKDDYLKMQDQ